MTLAIPCGRSHPDPLNGREKIRCTEREMCPHCNAILILKAACLGVADRLDGLLNRQIVAIHHMARKQIDAEIGRLRADVARVDGRTE